MGDNNKQRWYSRPVLFVSNTEKARQHYMELLGFTEDWNAKDDDRIIVSQVVRGTDCELILCEDPQRAGNARNFVALDDDVLKDFVKELESKDVPIEQSWWGYPVLVVKDSDGNELMFPINETS